MTTIITTTTKKEYQNKINNELTEPFENRISNLQFNNIDSNNSNKIETNS